MSLIDWGLKPFQHFFQSYHGDQSPSHMWPGFLAPVLHTTYFPSNWLLFRIDCMPESCHNLYVTSLSLPSRLILTASLHDVVLTPAKATNSLVLTYIKPYSKFNIYKSVMSIENIKINGQLLVGRHPKVKTHNTLLFRVAILHMSTRNRNFCVDEI